jgi:hypothetical protein
METSKMSYYESDNQRPDARVAGAFRPSRINGENQCRSRRAKYDPRVEFVLMRNGRRLGLEYHRFIEGKLALIGFVEEPGACANDFEGMEDGEYVEFDARGVPEARLRRIARLAIEKILKDN